MIKFAILFIIISTSLFGQNKYLKIIDPKSNNIITKKNFTDSTSLYHFANDFIFDKNLKGYISANYDSIVFDSLNNFYFYLNLGERYFWKKVNFVNIPENELRKINIKQKTFNKNYINQIKLSNEINKIIKYYENNGFPFVRVKLDSTKINNNLISSNIIIKKNNFICLNNIKINGNAKISKQFLLKYFNIKKGDIYSEKKIKKIDNKIQNLKFISQKKTLQILFTKDSANINLFIDKKNANQFNGLLGFLPDNKLGKINLTGELNLYLINPFKHDEEIIFNWKKLEPLSQELNSELSLPYLLNTNFGLKAKFDLLKKDTTYLNTNPYLSALYYFSANNYVNIFFENKSSSLISSYGFENITVLPEYADFSTNLYGFGIFANNFDYFYNPRKGTLINISIGTGEKTILKNSKINKNLYDNILLKSNSLQAKSEFNFYIPIYNNFILKYRNSSGIIKSNNLFKNELYQLGGISTIRGFDEKSIFASSYTISSAEIRYLFEQNSAVYTFVDYCYYENKINNSNDSPFGFGVGVNFDTQIGIFTIDYALGSQQNNAIMLNSAKIHFGYLNRF